jgi:hypothetical protein
MKNKKAGNTSPSFLLLLLDSTDINLLSNCFKSFYMIKPDPDG